MSTKKERFEEALRAVHDCARAGRAPAALVAASSAVIINAYVKELEEKAAAPQKMREDKNKMFAVHLDFVHHELPRSKASDVACASITAYVDDLNTEVEKMCAECHAELIYDDAQKVRRLVQENAVLKEKLFRALLADQVSKSRSN